MLPKIPIKLYSIEQFIKIFNKLRPYIDKYDLKNDVFLKYDFLNLTNILYHNSKFDEQEKAIEKIINVYGVDVLMQFLIETKKIILITIDNNTNKDELKVDEPEGGVLDKVAFGEYRVGVENEINNNLEYNIKNYLQDHLYGYAQKNDYIGNQIIDILNSGKYKEVFHGPSQEYVYRGMGVTKDWLYEYTNYNEEDKKKALDIKSGVIFKPLNTFSSWTTNISITKQFAQKNVEMSINKIPIILVSKVSDNNFWSGPDGFYNFLKVSDIHRFILEREVIGIGDISLYKALLIL